MRFDDLPREYEPDARTAALRREERHEQVLARRQARAAVDDLGDQRAAFDAPAQAHVAAGRQRRVGRVLDQVDQRLRDLVGVDLDADGGTVIDLHRSPLLEFRRASRELVERGVRGCGGGSRASAV